MRAAHLLIAIAFALFACKDTEGTTPKDVPEGDADTDTDTDSDADADTDTDADTDDECWIDSPNGLCWSCPLPTGPEGDSLKALNQCSSLSAVPFDNASRIPASTWVPGDPLPPVP